MNKKAQGALEYLLIIGAAVIIAVIVIAVIMGLTQQGTKATEDANVEKEFDAGRLFQECIRADCNESRVTGLPTGKDCADYAQACAGR